MGKLTRNELFTTKSETKHEVRDISFRAYFLSEKVRWNVACN